MSITSTVLEALEDAAENEENEAAASSIQGVIESVKSASDEDLTDNEILHRVKESIIASLLISESDTHDDLSKRQVFSDVMEDINMTSAAFLER